MSASQEIIYPQSVTLVRARPEDPVTIAVGGNDTLNYGTTTALGTSLAARQSITFTTDQYIQSAGDGPVLLRRYDQWELVELGLASLGRQSATVRAVTCTADTNIPLVVVPCPTLVPHVTRMMFHVSLAVLPGASTTSFVYSINGCDSAGTIPVGGANIAFWTIENPPVGTTGNWASEWLYDPRLSHVPADVDLGTGQGQYLGLHIQSVGGSSTATSAILQVTSGAIDSITVDADSTSLLDGQGE